ncbi:phosphoribosylglycinamide formyltransferase [bacterium]|nr:phosphoribosylglycinamide formyltransferase [bacterium]
MKGGIESKKLHLGVFASGRGSNFVAILQAIQEGRLQANVECLISNNSDAGALSVAKKNNIPTAVIVKSMYASRDLFIEALLDCLKKHDVDFIVLAGYMKKIPPEVIAVYKNHLLNIHPALLPSFGGKGMYGHHVHESVLEYGCKVTGVTVHLVDDEYDHGPIVAQQSVVVKEEDTPETLAARVLQVEHQIYAETLQLFAEGRVEVKGQKVYIKKK